MTLKSNSVGEVIEGTTYILLVSIHRHVFWITVDGLGRGRGGFVHSATEEMNLFRYYHLLLYNAIDGHSWDSIGRSMTVPSTIRLGGQAEPQRHECGNRTTGPSTLYCTVMVHSPSGEWQWPSTCPPPLQVFACRMKRVLMATSPPAGSMWWGDTTTGGRTLAWDSPCIHSLDRICYVHW